MIYQYLVYMNLADFHNDFVLCVILLMTDLASYVSKEKKKEQNAGRNNS